MVRKILCINSGVLSGWCRGFLMRQIWEILGMRLQNGAVIQLFRNGSSLGAVQRIFGTGFLRQIT